MIKSTLQDQWPNGFFDLAGSWEGDAGPNEILKRIRQGMANMNFKKAPAPFPCRMIRCLISFWILVNTSMLWAGLDYDQDEDCDVDGVEIFNRLSVDDQNLPGDLTDFAAEFGTAQDCCNPIQIGTPIDGYPNWQERTMIVFTNMVRMAPVEYRDSYMAGFPLPAGGILNRYPAVAPLYWHHGLNQAARFHAEDLAFDCNILQHNSCDGTSWSDRIRRFYPYSAGLGENAAYGFSTPWATVNALLCDRQGSVCATDSSGKDGHRKNIMRAGYRELGTGYAVKFLDYWVQDFGGRQPESQMPLVSASHAFLEDGITSFLLNYFDSAGGAPRRILLVLDDIDYPLQLDLGNGAAGSYRVDVTRAAGCRAYFFKAVTANGVCYRYPGTSTYFTYGEGDCRLDYDSVAQ